MSDSRAMPVLSQYMRKAERGVSREQEGVGIVTVKRQG